MPFQMIWNKVMLDRHFFKFRFSPHCVLCIKSCRWPEVFSAFLLPMTWLLGDHTSNWIYCIVQMRSMAITASLLSNCLIHIKGRYLCYRPWRPLGLREVEAPTVLRQTANRWWQGCRPYAPVTLYPQASYSDWNVNYKMRDNKKVAWKFIHYS
jgi:hypothetical protein